MSVKTIVQYGRFKIHQEHLTDAELRMYQYIIASINHVFDMDSYLKLYGEKYSENTPPNIMDDNLLIEHISNNEPVPFYAQSEINSLNYTVHSLNNKDQSSNTLTLMMLVDNFRAEFSYIELELDNNGSIERAYDCKSSIVYNDISGKPDKINIQAVLNNEHRLDIEPDRLSALL